MSIVCVCVVYYGYVLCVYCVCVLCMYSKYHSVCVELRGQLQLSGGSEDPSKVISLGG